MNAMATAGRVAGVVGVVVCALAAGLRLTGRYLLGSYSIGTLFVAGVAAIVVGCFCLLWVLASRR